MIRSMFQSPRGQPHPDENTRQRQLILVRYGEDSSLRNMVANQTIVEAVPIPESSRSSRHVPESTRLDATRPRRRFWLCGGSGLEVEDPPNRPGSSSPRGHNSLPTAEVLGMVLIDPRGTVASDRCDATEIVTRSTTVTPVRDCSRSVSRRGGSQTISSFDRQEQPHRDRLGVLPRSSSPHDPQQFARMRAQSVRGIGVPQGEDRSNMTSLAEILTMQGVLAIGLPAEDHDGRNSGSSMDLPHDDIFPGHDEAPLPNEVSYNTVQTSARQPTRAVSEVTLPLELRGNQDTPDGDVDRDAALLSTGSFSKEDFLDDKQLEELVTVLEDIHAKHIVELKHETKSRTSILRSLVDPRTGKSLRSLASDSSELVNLMQEQYTALQLLTEAPTHLRQHKVGEERSNSPSEGCRTIFAFQR